MPGFSQLKQLSSDLLSIGDEVTLRAGRGERPVTIQIPDSIPDVNDSDDFALGIPRIQQSESVDDTVNDLANELSSEGEDGVSFDAPDLDSLLNPINIDDDASAGAEMPDLSMFDDPVEETVDDSQLNLDDEILSEPEETPISELSLEDLLSGADFSGEAESESPAEDVAEVVDDLEDLSDLADVSELDSEDNNSDIGGLDELSDLEDITDLDSTENLDDTAALEDLESSADDSASINFDEPEVSDFGGSEFSLDDMDDIEGFESSDEPEETADLEMPESFDVGDDLGSVEDLGDTAGLDDIEDLGDTAGFDDLGDLGDIGDIGDLGETADLEMPESFDAGDDSVPVEDLGDTSGLDDLGDLGDIGDLGETADLEMPESFDAGDDSVPVEDLGDTAGLDDLGDLGDIGDIGDLGETADLEMPESFDAGDDSVPVEDLGDTAGLDNLGDLGDISDIGDLGETSDLEMPESFDAGDDSGSVEDLGDTAGLDDLGDLGDTAGLDDLGDLGDTAGLDDIEDLGDTAGLDDIEDLGDTAGLDDVEDFSDNSDEDFGGIPEGLFDSNDSGSDIEDITDIDDIQESAEEGPIEQFDISEMENFDFGIPETDAQLQNDSDFQFGKSEDFAMEGEFEIPGFSDVETVKEEKSAKGFGGVQKGKQKKGKNKKDVDTPDFTGAIAAEELPPNTLSDEQYKIFLKNFSEYPLNVRLAFEDLIVQDEFTEDAEFEVIEKILAKAPARQVAAILEKMLDISIPVPRDFEHRSAEEYEAYKKSLSYQLKAKIIPGALVGMLLLLVGWGVFNFSKYCIYRPLKAISLYKQGYNLLQANEYPQSETVFKSATEYKLNKKWFFNYARGYREHKQYQRAGKMYENILYCFNHDKIAGLEYADMELNDLANYPHAEEIVRRQVLDYHINDKDGILLLGDIFLEWGTEKDPEKFEDARQQYATLLNLYGSNDLYLSRMMRYFIRVDNLRQVLTLRQNFVKDKQLSNADWTELGGYLLDKAYGPLSPADEYLRYQIEGLRGLLLTGVRTDKTNPVALYNLGNYYVLSKETVGIENTLLKSIENFNNVPSIKTRDLYKYIDAYRLLGEYYIGTQDYLKAQEQFAEGISLYTTERDNAGFKGTPKIGKIYEDLGNIKYFVSGDYDDALTNYNHSVELKNDSPVIRYKLGYIQYKNKEYGQALSSFMKTGDGNIKERNLIFAMANTLSIRGDDYAAQGYYENLISVLDDEHAERVMLFPQKNVKDNELVTTYLQASNNYGVTLYRLAKRKGNSSLISEAIIQFQQSLRAWDALTRNQTTMVRLGGTNLAQENIKNVVHKVPDFEPIIYMDIPKTLTDNERF